jgi:hypothetical protein
MKEFLIPVSFLCLLGFSAAAEQNQSQAPSDPKPAWQWSDEERLATRFAPAARAARIAAARQAGVFPFSQDGRSSLSRSVNVELPITDVIDGSVHPELLTPIELFNTLLLAGYMNENETGFIRSSVGRWKEFGLHQDPGNLIREAARTALDIQRRRRDDHAAGRPLTDTSDPAYCEEVFRALNSVQNQLGLEDYQRFIHLLYDTVASGQRQFSTEPPERVEASLRAKLRGCQ